MNLRRKGKESRKIRAALDLTPLIDVVFQLILFFMLSSTFIVQTSIPIQMPKAEGATNLEKKDISVTLMYSENEPQDAGPMFADDRQIEGMQELSEILVAARRERDDVQVVIRSDERVNAGRLVAVLGLAKSLGINHVWVAAQPVDEPE